jgi:hypothetical protein
MHAKFGRKTLREETTQRPRRRCEDDITIDIREIGGEMWIGFIWLRIWDSCGLLLTW